MIQNTEGGGGYDSKKEYVKSAYRTVGKYRYLYTWYYQNGILKQERELVGKSNLQMPSEATPRKSTSTKSKSISKSTPKKSMPSVIPQTKTEEKSVVKPSFNEKKPAPVETFNFNKQEPTKTETLVPQPPPLPSPPPTKTVKGQKSVTKYEYLYGMKDLKISHKQYTDKSVYVSTLIPVEGNVMQVSLEANEEHPVFDTLSGEAAERQTSVEYYIAPIGINPSPTLDDWYPILPESVKTIKSEFLMFGTARTASLRFPALIGSKEEPAVYKNGLKMNKNDWSFADGGYSVQLLAKKDPTAIYTIDYTPNAEFYNPWFIDINEKNSVRTKHTDVFESGTNHNKTVVLKNYPYVDYEAINTTEDYDPNTSSYCPIKVTLKDAGIIGPNRTTYKVVDPYDGTNTQKVFTKNITDYKTGIQKELTPYSIDEDKGLYNGFEYYQEGNKLFFSETFNKADIYTNENESHGNATIVVEYEYLASKFRVKIILRRNSTDENTLTPAVHEYRLKFKVMK